MESEIVWKVGDKAERSGVIVTILSIDFRAAGEPEVETLDEEGAHTWGLCSELDPLNHYVLQNKGVGAVGNSTLFWAGFGGYRANLQEAKRFTLEEARQTVESAKGSHDFVIWDYNDLMEIVEFHVDAGRLWEMRGKAK